MISSDNSDQEPYQDSGSEYLPDEPETEEVVLEQNSGFKPKKRVRNENKWKRSIAKVKRLKGEQYKNYKGIVVQAKLFEPIICPCSNQCHMKIPVNRQENLFSSFYDLKSYDLQTSFIFGLVDVVTKQRCYKTDNNPSRRSNTRLYHLIGANGDKIVVCKEFFKKVFNVSDGRISRILCSKAAGDTPPVDERGKHAPSNKTSEETKMKIKNFINKFPTYQSHYSRCKNPHRKYLAPDLSLGKMYSLYAENTTAPASYFIFRNIFLREFNLHFHAPISDSCKKCDKFNIQINAAGNDETKNKIRIQLELHHRKAESARQGMKRDKIIAQNDESITAVCFDLMKTLPTPVLSTGEAYYKRQLWTYCLCIHNLGTSQSVMYVWDESIASRGPSEIGSCLLHYLKSYVTSTKLIMYSDQCGGQNRNIKIALLCNYVVTHPDFSVEEIDHKFLVSGHSYLPCDQDFGLIEKEKKFFKDVFIPDQWKNVIRSAKKKSPFVVISMTNENFYSLSSLQDKITNRKKTTEGDKVSWLQMQWLNFKKDEPFLINYKISNNEMVEFQTIDISKRRASRTATVIDLNLLYPNGHQIDIKKKKNLLELSQYIPPVYLNFYQGLKTTEDASEDFIEVESDEEEVPIAGVSTSSQ